MGRTVAAALLAAGVAMMITAPAMPGHDPLRGIRLDAPGERQIPDGFLTPDDVHTLAENGGAEFFRLSQRALDVKLN